MKIKRLMAAVIVTAALITVSSGTARGEVSDAESMLYDKAGGYSMAEKGVFEAKIVDAAKSAVGTPYNVLGLTPETGFNTTSFAVWCLNESGCGVYKYTDIEHLYARALDVKNAPHDIGDLVFFSREEIEHVGIYIGNGKALIAGTEVREITIGVDEWSKYQTMYGKYTPYVW